jgi:hypothetical protein
MVEALRTGGRPAFAEVMSSTEVAVQANIKQMDAVKSA